MCYPKHTNRPIYNGLVTQLESIGIQFVEVEYLTENPLIISYEVVVDGRALIQCLKCWVSYRNEAVRSIRPKIQTAICNVPDTLLLFFLSANHFASNTVTCHLTLS